MDTAKTMPGMKMSVPWPCVLDLRWRNAQIPGRRVYEEGAAVFFTALDHFAALGYHPELAHLPFVMYGSSNGGASTYGFVNYAPERPICSWPMFRPGEIPKLSMGRSGYRVFLSWENLTRSWAKGN